MIAAPDALLAVIDLQRIFTRGPWAVPRIAEILAPITRLHRAFAGRTVFTRFQAPPDPVGAWRAYYAQWPFAAQPSDAPDYQLVEPFDSQVGPTVDATTFGKWHAGLEHHIPAGGRLVVAGVATECCVLSTVLAAADAGVRVRVVADACAGADDEAHHQALAVMARYAPLVEIVTTNVLLAGPNPTANCFEIRSDRC